MSDHSPLVVWIQAQLPSSLPREPCKLNAFWLQLFPSHERIDAQIQNFFVTNQGYVEELIHWEAFNACLRGILIAEMNTIKRSFSEFVLQAESQVWQLELQYISTSIPQGRRGVFSLPTGFPAIGAIRTPDGHIINSPDLITGELTHFYATLYQSQSQYCMEEIMVCLNALEMPTLTSCQRARLNLRWPWTRCKRRLPRSLHPKLLGNLFCQNYYRSLMLPMNAQCTMPGSMSRANIVLLQKRVRTH